MEYEHERAGIFFHRILTEEHQLKLIYNGK
jgi:hypothetical protein